jgi:uncharacterized protein
MRMVRFLLLVFLAYVIYLVLKSFRSLGRRPQPAQRRPRSSGVMVKDEVCDTYVPREEAIRETIDGKEYYFCSKECHKKFLDRRKNSA